MGALTGGRRGPRLSARWEGPLTAALLLLGAVLRIGWPGLTEFKFSEARLAALALEISQEGRLPLVGVPSSASMDHSPVSVYLYLPAFLQGSNPIPATVYGGFVGLLAVALCFRFGRLWPGGGRSAAFTAALLAAGSPWGVLFCRKIWQITFVPLLALAFVGLAVSALVLGKPWRLCSCLTVYAILAQVHPSAVSLAPALLLWLVIFWRRELIFPLLSGALLGACTAIPFLVHQAQTGWGVVSSLHGLDAGTWDLSAFRLAWQTVAGMGLETLAGVSWPKLRLAAEASSLLTAGGWLLTASGAVLALRAIDTRLRGKPYKGASALGVDIILLSWMVIPLIVNIRHSLDLQLHFFAVTLPAAWLICGRAAQALAPQARRASQAGWLCTRFLHKAFLAVSGVLAIGQVTCLVLMGRFVAQNDTSGGFGRPLSHYSAITEAVLGHARDVEASEVLVIGEGGSPVVDELPAIFDVLLRDRISYRFVDSRASALFPMYRAVVLEAARQGPAATWYGAWPASELMDGFRMRTTDGSWPQSGLQTIAAPRLLENGIELQGYRWSCAAQDCRFWLLWQVLWEPEADSHFFVHIVDEQARLVGQKDIAGLAAEYRRPGDRAITAFDIMISAPSSATLWALVGMYGYPEIAGIPVIDDSGIPLAPELRLGPLQGQAAP